MIFLDSPVGTGFSYAESLEGYYSSDTKSPYAVYLFLRKVSKTEENMSPMLIGICLRLIA